MNAGESAANSKRVAPEVAKLRRQGDEWRKLTDRLKATRRGSSSKPKSDSKLRDLDVGVYVTGKDDNKIYLRRESDGKPGTVLESFDDLDAMAAWADEHGESELGDWARLEKTGDAPATDRVIAPSRTKEATDQAKATQTRRKANPNPDGLDDLTPAQLRDLADKHDVTHGTPARMRADLRKAGVSAPSAPVKAPAKATPAKKAAKRLTPRQVDALEPSDLPAATRDGRISKATALKRLAFLEAGPQNTLAIEMSGRDPGDRERDDYFTANAKRLLAEYAAIREEIEAADSAPEGAGIHPALDKMLKTGLAPLPSKGLRPTGLPKPRSAPAADLPDLQSLPTEARRDALDLLKVGNVEDPDSLKGMLRARGLPVSGTKRQLVDRLVADMDGGSAGPATPKVERPVGRDISRDHDALAPIYNANVDEDGSWVDSPAGDLALSGVARQQGFDAPPTVLSSGDFDRAVADGGHVMYRGVDPDSFWGEGQWGKKLSGAEVHAQTREGDYQPGYGIFGNGYYFATDKEKAESFSDGQPGSLGRYALPADARVIDYEDLRREYGEWFDSDWSSASLETQGVTGDFGRYAASRGFDAIRVPVGTRIPGGGTVQREEWVVLNRGSLIADSGPS